MNIQIFDVYILLLATPKTIVLGDKNDFCNYIFALVCNINQIIKRNNQIIKTNSHIQNNKCVDLDLLEVIRHGSTSVLV